MCKKTTGVFINNSTKKKEDCMSYVFMGFLGRTVEVNFLDLILLFGLFFVIGMVYSFQINKDLTELYNYIHKVKMNIIYRVTHLKK